MGAYMGRTYGSVKRLAGWYLSVLWLLLCTLGVAHAEEMVLGCGDPFHNHFGPFDYRVAKATDISMVERVHFTPKVESLQGGNTSMGPAGDLGYTLNVFPNHHRALMAMAKYAIREKSSRPGDSKISIECRFIRAEQFRPDDAVVKMIHGVYLLQSGHPESSVQKLEEALKLEPGNGNTLYNLGLAYLELRSYDKALSAAHHAYALGFNLPGLKAKLERAGQWREATAEELALIRRALDPDANDAAPSREAARPPRAQPAAGPAVAPEVSSETAGTTLK